MIKPKNITIKNKTTGELEFYNSLTDFRCAHRVSPIVLKNFIQGKSHLNKFFEIIELDGNPCEQPEYKAIRGRRLKCTSISITVQHLYTGEVKTFNKISDLAKYMQVTLPTASRFVNGKSTPRCEMLYKIIKIEE